MNEKVWHEIFKNYIADFHAIDRLQVDGIVDDEYVAILKNKLLVDIIVTMQSEVEE